MLSESERRMIASYVNQSSSLIFLENQLVWHGAIVEKSQYVIELTKERIREVKSDGREIH